MPRVVSTRDICLNYLWRQVIRKEKIMSFLNKNIKDYVADDDDIVFEYEDYYCYSYPYETDVPEAWYYSIIADVKKPSICSKSCIDVYYKIVPVQKLNAYHNGYIDAENIDYYYIRQRYIEDSIYYREFCSAMYNALGIKKFKIKDLIGVTEGFHLIYKKDGGIGSIEERRPMNIEVDLFNLDVEDSEE